MTKRELERELEGLFEELSSAKRVEAFIRAAGAGEDDIIKKLSRTAPRDTYSVRDPAYHEGAREVFLISGMASRELVRCYQAIELQELTRDRAVALVCLNEALARLSQGHFSVDTNGDMTTPQSWANDYGHTYEPDMGRLATKYRELWDATELEFCFAEDAGSGEYFPSLAASASLGYRTDLEEASSASPSFVHGEIFLSEVRLLTALARFAEAFHTWRLLAEEHLGIDLDMLLSVAQPTDAPPGLQSPASIDEATCRAVLSSMSGYLDELEEVREQMAAHYDREAEVYPGPETVAEEQAAELAEAIDIPLT